ncbi:toxin-antitoxin system YwqK family antitoxin [Pseudofulvibacter geojedonensis]|uniref:Toxin-antitoxin system YwqK family antitoxin n=1 Tax=Pseudofulvibacter geojedonensis TaxID=1123758 RepID=A0ABW3I6B9_9FLAO
MRNLIVLICLLIVGFVSAQEYNQFDKQGERHGKWRKFFPGTEKVRYTGQFEHGKEVGVFKFYHKEAKAKHPSLIKTFQPNSDLAEVKYYTSTGVLLNEGFLNGKIRVGEWKFYHKNSKEISEIEFYEKGRLNGKKTSYYKNGKILQVENYTNGKLNGKKQMFTNEGVLVKDMNYVNGRIDGYFTEYRAGKKILEGKYAMGKPRGVWKYYKDGKLIETKDYTKSNNPKKKKAK